MLGAFFEHWDDLGQESCATDHFGRSHLPTPRAHMLLRNLQESIIRKVGLNPDLAMASYQHQIISQSASPELRLPYSPNHTSPATDPFPIQHQGSIIYSKSLINTASPPNPGPKPSLIFQKPQKLKRVCERHGAWVNASKALGESRGGGPSAPSFLLSLRCFQPSRTSILIILRIMAI